MKTEDKHWDLIIIKDDPLLDFKLKEIIEYKDLLTMFIKRDIITLYKQTILGPVWYFIQPLLTMLIYIIVFSNIANIPTDKLPPSIFYLTGIIIWNYFSECFTQTADTFYQNTSIFGKVYFPRLVIPLSKVTSAIIKFFIQSIILFIVYIYLVLKGVNLKPTPALLLVPYLLLLMGCLGLGAGILFSSITTKYRDLKFIINFFIQLLMFMSPIIYPMSILPDRYHMMIFFNPLAHIIEAFKFALLNSGEISINGLLYATLFSLTILISGILVFNKTERRFMDTI